MLVNKVALLITVMTLFIYQVLACESITLRHTYYSITKKDPPVFANTYTFVLQNSKGDQKPIHFTRVNCLESLDTFHKCSSDGVYCVSWKACEKQINLHYANQVHTFNSPQKSKVIRDKFSGFDREVWIEQEYWSCF